MPWTGCSSSSARSIDRVLYLGWTTEELVAASRVAWICPTCGRTYPLRQNPPAEGMTCVDDGSPLVQREDDKPEAVRPRIEVYLQKTMPVLDHYRPSGRVREIDGDGRCGPVTARSWRRSARRRPPPHDRGAKNVSECRHSGRRAGVIVRKTPHEIELMRRAGVTWRASAAAPGSLPDRDLDRRARPARRPPHPRRRRATRASSATTATRGRSASRSTRGGPRHPGQPEDRGRRPGLPRPGAGAGRVLGRCGDHGAGRRRSSGGGPA